MSQDYSFNKFWKDLDNGIEIYYTYLGRRYLIYKMTKNCYKQELIKDKTTKSSQSKIQMLTLKRVMELFPNMQDFEYKTGIN